MHFRRAEKFVPEKIVTKLDNVGTGSGPAVSQTWPIAKNMRLVGAKKENVAGIEAKHAVSRKQTALAGENVNELILLVEMIGAIDPRPSPQKAGKGSVGIIANVLSGRNHFALA